MTNPEFRISNASETHGLPGSPEFSTLGFRFSFGYFGVSSLARDFERVKMAGEPGPTMAERLEQRLALSTCWNSHRHEDGYAMLAEIRELGFERVELSHGISAYLVPGILQACEEGLVRVDSVHNFCPLPSIVRHAAPNLFQPSSKRGEEQRAWLRYSRQTLEFAAQVGASHVVMHSGSIAFRFRSPAPILSRHESADPDTDRPGARDKALRRLERAAQRAIPRVRDRYAELLPDAREHDLVLAVENREGVLELPLDSEFSEFIGAFDDPHVAPWIDTGHAEIKRRLGLLDYWTLLEKISDSLAGFHLHDVDGEGRDHQPIGTGTIDFRRLGKHLREHHLLVVELNPRLGADEVVRSREALLECFSGNG